MNKIVNHIIYTFEVNLSNITHIIKRNLTTNVFL